MIDKVMLRICVLVFELFAAFAVTAATASNNDIRTKAKSALFPVLSDMLRKWMQCISLNSILTGC